ncbi:ricin-type beta-trefoil lectin domain protein [Actinoplanes sp. NPDC051851]|uniref:ricin-type beta-trefoil lectin domain protein n=1 Tax=Actinoplanes sp. NPDC051851 TaxID=3154753 RepID=UPI0034218179
MNLIPRVTSRLNRAVAVVAVTVLTLGLIVGMSTRSEATSGATVTFVNATGETLWIGSNMQTDGSKRITGLPTLAPGAQGSVKIPDGGSPSYWRGTFFARQRCTGDAGSTFHCLVADCGNLIDQCVTGEQDASLAEFNFDQNDAGAPWYDVSYVNAVSTAITIDTPGVTGAKAAGTCSHMDCSGGQLLAACPAHLAVTDPTKGDRINCINKYRNDVTDYVEALRPYGPRAYLWSTNDAVEGNETMFTCPGCGSVVITFRNSGTVGTGGVTNGAVFTETGDGGNNSGTFAIKGDYGRCVDVPGANSADGLKMQMWDCNGGVAQKFSWDSSGRLVVMGKCLDVAGAATENGTRIQLANCSGNPAQVWELDGKMLRNPMSNRCLDIRDWNKNNGAGLQIWDCNPAGQVNQNWTLA